MGLCGSKTPAAVQEHQPPPPPQQEHGEENRVQAHMAARLEQQLRAQLRDVADVVLACQLDGCCSCLSSVLRTAATMGLSRPLVERVEGSDDNGNTTSSAPPEHTQHPDIRKDIAAALLAAAGKGHAECLRLLLDTCSSLPSTSVAALLDARDDNGRTALISAARQGHTDCVQLLLDHSPRAHVTAFDIDQKTALLRAAEEGHTACVQLLLHHSPDIQVVAADCKGLTALMFAALKGHTACVQLLLHHNPGIQVAATDRGGHTALMYAASRGVTASVQLLLCHSPDIQVSAHSAYGAAALCCAANGAHADCLQLLLAHGPSKQQLSMALSRACRCLAQLTTDHVDHASSPDRQRSLALKKCAELLLANRAVLPADATDGDKEVLQSIIADLAARSLVPDMANEAVVGLALAAASRRK